MHILTSVLYVLCIISSIFGVIVCVIELKECLKRNSKMIKKEIENEQEKCEIIKK